jgi:hypothetical protein
MGRDITEKLLGGLRGTAAGLPDKREASNGRKYGMADFILSAFAVFYFQHPSLLDFQEALKSRRKRNNLETLFGVEKTPGADQIRNILDGIRPEGLHEAFDRALEVAREEGVVEHYRVLNGTIPVALDGTWYFSSEDIHCGHCLRMEKKKRDGSTETLYYHDMVAAAIVKPGKPVVVLPLIPEFIRNEDGSGKQDCERNAAKRWIQTHRERYGPLKVTILGDDLYCCHSICKALAEGGMSFLLTCKDESHPWIAEQVKYGEAEMLEEREWMGRGYLVYRYQWVNGIENRAEGEKMTVNYLKLEIYNEKKGEVTYRNSWITDHSITPETVKNIAGCARARWKIENEHNQVLKHHGYNLKHNFGHGKEQASEIFCLLNLLAFLYHGVQALADDNYRAAWGSCGRKANFFWGLRYETSRYLHEDWHSLFLTVSGKSPDG